ncbi:hypothetical protein Baya_1907 [Bagarius yarrelli]|uniref:Uncharacterized protein n=1 Tax=Bagarius yarrelli TaxID=175774 RepID=A0A556TMF8_BAGYA|nr:hypothetical protein Baya_1907 [Bagarius yarrelli]
MMSVTEKFEFTPANTQQPDIIWSRRIKPQKGQVISSGDERRFIISSVTFNDQGNYTEWNFWSKVASVHLVKVLTKRRVLSCMPGRNLSISLDGLLKDDVKLRFFGKDFNITLVEHGFPVGNRHFGFWGRVQLTAKNIQVLMVDSSDVGKYVLSDHRNNTVTNITLNMADATHVQEAEAGTTFSISLDSLAKEDVTLIFTNQDSNVTLVELGLPVNSSHNQFSERIQVTSSDIQVLNMDVSDMGNYTLIDREGRKAKIITPQFVNKSNPLLALLLLLLIPPCICCCYGKKILKKYKEWTSKTTTANTTTTDATTTSNAVKVENQNLLLADRARSKAPEGNKPVTH